MRGTDWVAWHRAYDDPTSSLSARLAVVQRRIGEVLDARPRRPVRVLSLCAGDGRDLLPELAIRPGLPAEVTLVELDANLAEAARRRAATIAHAAVEVRTLDAGSPSAWADVIPVDLLLLCGIFGNVSDDDVRRMIAAAPGLLHPGGTVIWTRGAGGAGEVGADPPVDLRPVIRKWFTAAGFDELGFDGPPRSFGVGVATWPGGPSRPLPDRLFEFVR